MRGNLGGVGSLSPPYMCCPGSGTPGISLGSKHVCRLSKLQDPTFCFMMAFFSLYRPDLPRTLNSSSLAGFMGVCHHPHDLFKMNTRWEY